jgi:hypothetical protein
MVKVINNFGVFANSVVEDRRVKRICNESEMFNCEEHERYTARALDDYLRKEGVLRYNLLFRSLNDGNVDEVLKRKPNTLFLMLTKGRDSCSVQFALTLLKHGHEGDQRTAHLHSLHEGVSSEGG